MGIRDKVVKNIFMGAKEAAIAIENFARSKKFFGGKDSSRDIIDSTHHGRSQSMLEGTPNASFRKALDDAADIRTKKGGQKIRKKQATTPQKKAVHELHEQEIKKLTKEAGGEDVINRLNQLNDLIHKAPTN